MIKTVYFLGAGFSADAGAPLQGKIMGYINSKLRLNLRDNKDRKALRNFDLLISTLKIGQEFIEDYTLEDLFTPIDRCLKDNIPLREIPSVKLRDMRDDLYYLVGKSIELGLNSGNEDGRYLDIFAQRLVKDSKTRANMMYKQKVDPVAVISTNWDITLDTRLFDLISESTNPVGTVDYCCKVSSFYEQDITVKPGLEILGGGGYCVKLMKLHGSLNWMICPNCQRTYVDSKNKVALRESVKCRHCQEHIHAGNIMLEPNVIVPTFMKDLSSLQYKMTWHQAAIELAEASKVVFIGYSLPSADFEIRQLLTRMIKPTAQIVMVTKTTMDENWTENREEKLAHKIAEKEKVFNVFFGRKIQAYHKGVKNYVLENYRDH